MHLKRQLKDFCAGRGSAAISWSSAKRKKGTVFYALIEKPGRPAQAIVAEVLERVIRGFPWPKSMRWGSGTLRWVRPLQSILCLLSDEAGAGSGAF